MPDAICVAMYMSTTASGTQSRLPERRQSSRFPRDMNSVMM